MEKVENTRVFIEELPSDVRKDEISKEFSSFGRIAKIYLIYDPPGSGFVEYFEASDAAFAAKQMDGETFMGSKIRTQLTRGGIARGRGRSSFPGRREFTGSGYQSQYDSRDRGGRGFSSRGGRGSRGFDSRGRGRDSYRGSRGGSRGSGYGGDRSYSGGSGRSYSRGGGKGRGYYEGGSQSYSSRMHSREDDMYGNGYEKYQKYSRSDRSEGDYMRYTSDKTSSRRGEYTHSRSPISGSPDRYEPTSYQRSSSSYGGRRSPNHGY